MSAASGAGIAMTAAREHLLADLMQFLRTIQKPDKPVESMGLNERLVASGLIDSLAIIQLVMYLEERYAIDFAASGLDPERLASMGSIIDLIEEAGTWAGGTANNCAEPR